MIFDKNLNILLSLIFFEKDLDIMFNNDVNGKKRLSRVQKCHFKIVGQCSFFKKGLTHDFRQKFENSPESHFL